MRCPNDNSALIVTERQGIDVHSCPICKGSWLERGGLDEIINRSIPLAYGESVKLQSSHSLMDWTEDPFDDRLRDADKTRRRRDKYSEFDDDRPRKGKKKKSKRDMLEDVLEF